MAPSSSFQAATQSRVSLQTVTYQEGLFQWETLNNAEEEREGDTLCESSLESYLPAPGGGP